MSTTSIFSDQTRAALEAIKTRRYTVAIIGLGYIGLPLFIAFHAQEFPMMGVEVDPTKIKSIENGLSYFAHIPDEKIQSLQKSDRCHLTADFSRIKDADAVLICVPTPLSHHREPDLSYVQKTVRSLAPYLKKGHMLILESTTYPGTTEEVIKPICEKISGLKAGQDFFLAYSPEREDPGNTQFDTATIPKIIGADDEKAFAIASTLYSEIVCKVVPVSNTKTGEAVKLLENIFRCVNIALVNELKVVFEKMGIDIHEVIEAAKTKPFGYMPFYPGPGVGGHCIPVDPFYLKWKARALGIHTRFIELAGEINTVMPHYVVKRTIEALNSYKKSVNGARILCIGLAYKPDIDDCRESPTFAIMRLLDAQGADVEYFDPYIPQFPPIYKDKHWSNRSSIQWESDRLSSFDAAIVVTNHTNIHYKDLLQCCPLIIDTRNALASYTSKGNQVWKA
ncbi:MAG: nucleotide sugar dehydrogenase [Chlamydiota bacterium]